MSVEILQGDVREMLATLPDKSVDCCVTSPPYFGLRDYGVAGQIGLEPTPTEYISEIVSVFREVHRVLKDEGTLWLNLGDSYASFRDGKATPDTQRGDSTGTLVEKGMARNRMSSTFAGTGIKHKDLIGIPWRVAFALQADGWYLRQDLIWHKPNPMPESVKDRCTKAHEYIFLLTKKPKYYFDHEAVKEPCSPANIEDFKRRKTMNNKGGGAGSYEEARPDLTRGRDAYMPKDFMRNRRSVWTVTTKPFKGAHFATFPPDLIEPCVLAGCPVGGVILDPFFGSGTTGVVAIANERKAIGVELNPEYVAIAQKRLAMVDCSEEPICKSAVTWTADAYMAALGHTGFR